MKGKLKIHRFESQSLVGNTLGDPHIRDILVYSPENYSPSKRNGYPVIYLLPAFGNDSHSTIKRDPFAPSIFERLENLIKMNKSGDMIIVVIDCFNKLGGSQYINSDAIGMYKDYFINEIIPYIDNTYNTAKRALIGKSSGGFGAITIAMQHPNIFAAVGAHSFDAGFEYCYFPDLPVTFKTLKKYGSIKKWISEFWSKEDKRNHRGDFSTLNIISMAAHYSPNLNNFDMHIDLPFNITNGEFNNEIWKIWKTYDPIQRIDKYYENLRKLNIIYTDCGTNDEFNMNIGNKIFSEKCKKFNINCEYEEFDGGHFNTNHRFNISLEKVYKNIT